MGPGEQRELTEIILLDQRQHEPHEPCNTNITSLTLVISSSPMMYIEKEISLWYFTSTGRKSTLLTTTPNCSTSVSP